MAFGTGLLTARPPEPDPIGPVDPQDMVDGLPWVAAQDGVQATFAAAMVLRSDVGSDTDPVDCQPSSLPRASTTTLPEMEAKGIRLLGRTTIECSVDAHAAAVADAVARVHAALPPVEDAMLVDLFCGSGNLGHHLGERLGYPVYASELDPGVHAATRHNLDRVGSTIDLHRADYRDLIARLPPIGPNDTYAIEPPWGSAFGTAGLDLTRTTPPVPEILADIRRARAGRPCLVAIKTNDKIAHDSLDTAFHDATHLRTVRTADTLPHGANMRFHIYRLADPPIADSIEAAGQG